MRKSEQDVRQVAALPIRVDEAGRVHIGLVTSRETHRWIVPKGWPMHGLEDWEAAGIEAKEEAGLRGRMLHRPVGTYHYWQRTQSHFRLVAVSAFLMRVSDQKRHWKEQGERAFEWVTLPEAADRLEEPELVDLVMGLPGNETAWDFLHRGAPAQPLFA